MFYSKYKKYKFKYTNLKQNITHVQKGGTLDFESNLNQIIKIQNSPKPLTLVFGAGNINTSEALDLYRFGEDYVVVTNDPEQIDKEGTPYLLLDFNDYLSFISLTNKSKYSLFGRFDNIIVDVSTHKFLKWNKIKLEIIRRLLKPGGYIYIPADISHRFGVFSVKDLKSQQRGFVDNESTLSFTQPFIVLGPGKISETTEEEEKERHRYNMKILENSGYKNVQLIGGLRQSYPVTPSKYGLPKEYYTAKDPDSTSKHRMIERLAKLHQERQAKIHQKIQPVFDVPEIYKKKLIKLYPKIQPVFDVPEKYIKKSERELALLFKSNTKIDEVLENLNKIKINRSRTDQRELIRVIHDLSIIRKTNVDLINTLIL